MKEYFKSKINLLAISRGVPEVVAPLIPDEGKVFVFSDVFSVEPTVTLNFVYCDTLDYCTFSGKGKMPYYKGDRFMISDPYLALVGTIPFFRPAIKEMLDKGVFDNWVTDPDSVKEHKQLKKLRKLCKGAHLGLSYGLSPLPSKWNPEGGLLNVLKDGGFEVTEDECVAIHSTYWKVLYPELSIFKKALEQRVRDSKKGLTGASVVTNILGFKINPSKPSDAFNAMIQSSVASLLDYYELLLDKHLADVGGTFMLRIHDEPVVQVPKERAEEFCKIVVAVGEEISEYLGLTYPLRFNPQIASNFFEGK